MAGFTLKRIDDMEAVFAGAFKRARAELGVSSFGIQVIDMPPNADRYPEHTHAEDGQEEVYLPLRGSGEIEIGAERHRLDPDTMVRVGPGTRRKLWTRDEPLRVVIVGGVPGKAYEPPAVTELGAPDPLTASRQGR
jgi:mannose-6-phosphate isomerase-like protein (cupin superfamily)